MNNFGLHSDTTIDTRKKFKEYSTIHTKIIGKLITLVEGNVCCFCLVQQYSPDF